MVPPAIERLTGARLAGASDPVRTVAASGHQKAVHRMDVGRNNLAHSLGDAMNAIPAAGAATSRLLLHWIITILLAFL